MVGAWIILGLVALGAMNPLIGAVLLVIVLFILATIIVYSIISLIEMR
jgi:hypothetical protein